MLKVSAVFKTQYYGYEHADWVAAESGCWSMLKGGLTVNASGPAQLYFEARKSSVKFLAVDAKGNPLANATVSIGDHRPNFPFGCAISKHILTNPAYQQWFASRSFTVTTFWNEMKWPGTEWSKGIVDYSVPDSMLQFAKKHSISVRGHNVFWNEPKFQPRWVASLPSNDLQLAVENRIKSVVSRYAGKVIHWDVLNENMHFDFYDGLLGQNASSILFSKVHEVDRGATSGGSRKFVQGGHN